TPAGPSISKGLTQQFTATGTYTDNSTQSLTGQVTWASGTISVATISSTGLATGVSAGTSGITTALGGITSPSDTLTVTAAAPPALVTIKSVSLEKVTIGKTKTTAINVLFTGQVNAALADNLAVYTLATIPHGKKHTVKGVALGRAIYSTATE